VLLKAASFKPVDEFNANAVLEAAVVVLARPSNPTFSAD
jgi:hypothetical protein